MRPKWPDVRRCPLDAANLLAYTDSMCGIAGVYNIDGQTPDREALARMARLIAHRGPDGERFYCDGGLGMAHRHLRIIDLSDAAMQPMPNEDERIWVIFNGEIYNYIELRPELEARGHSFRSRSDTEVLVHAYEEWGIDCLHRFNGMFAFALWDGRARQLFVARDRMGVKPLYYAWDGRTFVFGSEIKALLAHPGIEPRPHLHAIAQYMNGMYNTGEDTWFEGIRQLLPGHLLLVGPDGLKVRRWWDIPIREDELGQRPERYYIRKTRALLEDSVRLRLRSDVPLGAHLSGGLDSSAIVGLLSAQLRGTGERVRTFSGAFAEGPAYDERPYIHQVVRRYCTDHHETIPTAHDLAALAERMVWHMDQPAAGPGILLQWKVCELSRARGVIVINGGQGGDEAWGGYYGYIPAYVRTLLKQARQHPSLYAQLARDMWRMAARPAVRAAITQALQTGRRGRFRPVAALGSWAGERFDGLDARVAGEAGLPPLPQTLSAASPLAEAMYWDMKWYLPALLHVEDRTSMAFSLESRAPLLDYRLIEHAASVPGVLRLKDLQLKHILRQAVEDLLPPAVYRRTDKMGMPTPISVWFRGSLAGWLRDQLLAPESLDSGLLSHGYVKQAVDEHLCGRRDRGLDLWKALNVVLWWRVFFCEA